MNNISLNLYYLWLVLQVSVLFYYLTFCVVANIIIIQLNLREWSAKMIKMLSIVRYNLNEDLIRSHLRSSYYILI